MAHAYSLTVALTLLSTGLLAQPVFTNGSGALSHNANSGGCMAVVDMDKDGLDDIVQLSMSTHVYILYQNPDHSFVTYDYGQVDNSEQWGWAIADLDNDGHKDICSGVSITRYLRISARGVYTLSNLNGPSIFTQGMSMADMNNDGRVDVYACHDNGAPNIWFTDANGVPQYQATYIDWSTNPASDMSGNYGSTFTDFDDDGDIDLHISHCRQGVNDPNDPRRWDRLFVNDGNNQYSDQAASYGLENREQVWTSDFGDYDNDGDLDVFSTTHSSTLMLFENDGTGHYTDVTTGSNLENYNGFFLQGLFRDMDNDGYLDIMTGTEDLYFKGNGDGTFDEVTNLFPATKNMLSFAFGDLNGDGFEDVYASYGDAYVDGDPSFPDRLWLNTPNGNHYLNVNLKGVVSNEDAIGAKVKIWGPWGVQVREVHSGESYGIVNTGTCHFGLGGVTTVDSLVVYWPSGQVDTYTDIDADQGITLLEGICIAPIAQITTQGAPVVCAGGTPITLTANPGFSYTWSTSETTQSIDVNVGGPFTVIIDDGTGCTGEATITVTENPDETPTISVNGETVFCQGGSVELISSSANGYAWSTSEVTQSIQATANGSYTVSIEGVCGTFTSDAVDVQVINTPVAPTTTGATILGPGTADISATGTAITWYDAAIGGNEVGTGSPFTTPMVNSTTSFWAADVNQFQGGTSYGGQTDNTTSGQYHTNDGFFLLFDAYERFTIRSVKVYSDEVGVRTIAVVDENTGLTVASVSPNIPIGTSRVQLDLEVLQPGSYSLRCVGTPDLWRDGMGSNPAYPYALGTVGSITSSSAGGANALEFYYFFYDWEVERWGVTCASPRSEAVVTVSGVGINEASNDQALSLQPNPTDDLVVLTFSTGASRVNAEVLDMTGRLVLIAASTSAVNGRLAIDVSALAPGQYMVRAMVDDHSQVLPLIVR
ncbi:MAG: VCBS repeat-containing protein [Flavobacteriales bacterium]|nr:VCBS repeat-containing protein [Flavobacteriales bacterium]MBK7270416.1 VCBS repeat-containing protein [Flavobacteriales bacterium]MBK7751414.1 VCBS repeat-containing protein [Flavobacteriales bacterium]MBK9073755.1 VCBS repeat-containing protein [Flavobacteriales bacterium]MBK9539867.1 VCBS repeat-containing protein [Flavobacteriales bacterium]